MALESEADLASFFDADEFGTPALYRAGGVGAPREVVGIFDQAYAAPGLGGLAGEGSEVAFRCAASALPTAQQGDALRVAATTWRVRSVRPDGTGTLILILGR